MTRFHSFQTKLIMIFCATALTACASTVFEGKYPRADGWRRAWVVSLQPGERLERPRYWTCTRDLPVEARATRQYAVVRYLSGHYTGFHAVEVPAGSEFRAGERVYVNLNRCRDALAARQQD